MSIRFDGNLGIGNIDVRDLIGLSDDEIRERFKESLRGLNEADLSEFMDELKTKLADIEKELHRLQDGFEDELDDAQDSGSIRAEVKAELRLKELDEILGELDGMDELAGDVVDRNLRLNRETSENEYFSYNTGGMDDLENGETVTITATGTPNNQAQQGIFGTEDPEAPQQDINDDGVIDANDAAAPDPSDLGQIVFININAGDKISLVSEAGGETKFKIATADGKVHYLVVKGNATLMLNGSNYANLADLQAWSDALLKRTYENNGSKSFYNNIHADEIAAAGTPVAEAIIPDSISANYASIVAEANALIQEAVSLRAHSTYTYDAAKLTTQDQQTLQKMIEALYSSNAINPASSKTIEQAWSEISGLLAGKSNAKESSLMGALTLLLAKHDYANFQTFMAYGSPMVQSSLNWASRTTSTSDSVNAFEKFIHLILNPEYFSTIISGDPGEDAKAWGHYADLMGVVDPAQAAVAEEGHAQASTDAAQQSFLNVNFPADELTDVKAAITNGANVIANNMQERGFTATDASAIKDLKTLFDDIRTASSLEEMQDKIRAYFGELDGTNQQDDLASLFVIFTHNFTPTLAQSLFGTDSGFNRFMYNTIANGDAVAYGTSGAVPGPRSIEALGYGSQQPADFRSSKSILDDYN